MYDFPSEGLHWDVIGLIAFLIIVPYLFAHAARYAVGPQRRRLTIFGLAAGTFALLCGIVVVPYQVSAYYKMKDVYDSRRYQVVEGTVRLFVPMPYGGHMNESFTVQKVKFEYSDYDQSYYGFNNTKSHGGPIDDGKTVRIAFTPFAGKNVILRLEVRR